MRTFNVFKHPAHGLEAVKQGFSWPAFFFGIFWMLAKKLWGLAGLFFLANVAVRTVEAAVERSAPTGQQVFADMVITLAYTAIWLVPAFYGNRWREAKLSKRGYRLLSTVEVETPDAAIARVLENA
jgi:lambda repressor-like predicted transcriptional regulator